MRLSEFLKKRKQATQNLKLCKKNNILISRFIHFILIAIFLYLYIKIKNIYYEEMEDLEW
jgi:large-conductance mechanosensitive channel